MPPVYMHTKQLGHPLFIGIVYSVTGLQTLHIRSYFIPYIYFLFDD
jgi:hypothetical protein